MRITVQEVKVGDVVQHGKQFGPWKLVVSIRDYHLNDCKAYYRMLYFEDGSTYDCNIFENIEKC